MYKIQLSGAAFFSMIIGGLAGTSFATALPDIRESLHLTIAETGAMIVARNVGFILASLFSGWLMERFGRKTMACIGAACHCAGLLNFGALPGLGANMVCLFFFGLGTGQIQLLANALIIDLYEERRASKMNLLHFFFTAGSIAGPLFMGLFLSAGLSWRLCFASYAALTFALMVMFLVVRFPVQDGTLRADEKHASVGLLHERLILLFILTLGLHVAVQVGTGNWMTSYLKERIALPVTGSMTILSLYWAGMAAGRFICSRIAHRVSHFALLLAMAVGSFCFLLMSLLTSSAELLLVLFALLGFCLSGFYPMLMVMGGGLYKRKAGTVIGVIAAGGSITSALLQWVMALISEASSIRIGLFFFTVLALLSVLATLAVLRGARRAGYQIAVP